MFELASSSEESIDEEETEGNVDTNNGATGIVQRIAPKKNTAKLSCPSCKRVFTSQGGLKYHLDKNVCGKDVKTLGLKARESLKGIISKRPEIVRVDEAAIEKSREIGKSDKILIPAPSLTKKRKRPTSVHTSKSISQGTDDQNADRWIPDISTLPPCTKEDRSSVVQLHGLPLESTPEHLVRFFSGLDVQKVWILSPVDLDIAEWDANYNFHHKKGLHTERLSSRVRVLVKFESASTAEIATCRSGELLKIPSSHGDEARPQCDFGVAIAVTQWFRTSALFIAQNQLYIDAKPMTSLYATFTGARDALDTAVIQIVSSSIIRHCELTVDEKEYALLAVSAYSNNNTNTSLSMIQKSEVDDVALHRDNLLKEYNRLRIRVQCAGDPGVLNHDSVFRLTQKALLYMKSDLERLEHRMLLARRWDLFNLPTFPGAAFEELVP